MNDRKPPEVMTRRKALTEGTTLADLGTTLDALIEGGASPQDRITVLVASPNGRIVIEATSGPSGREEDDRG